MKLRYIALPDDAVEENIIAEALSDKAKITEAKWRALEKLGIKRDGEDSPMRAWLLAMCRENNLPATIPVPQELADAILQDREAYRFLWWLA